MPLQRRGDTERLLKFDTGDLMNECCCPGCTDPPCHKFEACCDGAYYDDLPTYPHYIVITNSQYLTLGSPDCVVYHYCCYCDHSETIEHTTVQNESEVYASTYTDCSSCNDDDGANCGNCNHCNSCDPPLNNVYKVTYDVTLDPVSWRPEDIKKASREINGTHNLVWNGGPVGEWCNWQVPSATLKYWRLSFTWSWSSKWWYGTAIANAAYSTAYYSHFYTVNGYPIPEGNPCVIADAYLTLDGAIYHRVLLDGGSAVISEV